MRYMPTPVDIRAPGTSSLAEGGLDVSEVPSIDQFNRMFIDRMARGAYARWKNLMGASEAQIVGAIDAQEVAYRNAFKKFWELKGMSVDDNALKTAWLKARKAAIERYREYTKTPPQEQAATGPERPAAPMPVEPEPEPEEELVAVEVPPIPSSMEIQNWYEWNGSTLDSESLGKFNAAFVWKLEKAMHDLAKDPLARAAQLDEIRGVYGSVVFRMYQNSNPGYDIDTLHNEFEKVLPVYWKSILEALRLLGPAS